MTNNPGISLDLEWVNKVEVNLAAVNRRASSLNARRTVKKAHQAAWLLRAVTCIDLTTLAGDDSTSNVQRLCFKANNPIRKDLIDAMGVADLNIKVGAVCVYPAMVPTALKWLKCAGSQGEIPVASVATGFPAGLTFLETRVREIEMAVERGATEIDIVINRRLVLCGEWKELYDEISAMKKACGAAHMKTILGVGELGTLQNVYKASLVAMMAGSDFIKTSTGKEAVNATLQIGLVMCRAIREYFEKTSYIVGFKPAGGIRSAKQACQWLALIKEELGNDWLNSSRFRIGASSLLLDIERQLYHHVYGKYAASHQLAMA